VIRTCAHCHHVVRVPTEAQAAPASRCDTCNP
jgi:hypothetical protein